MRFTAIGWDYLHGRTTVQVVEATDMLQAERIAHSDIGRLEMDHHLFGKNINGWVVAMFRGEHIPEMTHEGICHEGNMVRLPNSDANQAEWIEFINFYLDTYGINVVKFSVSVSVSPNDPLGEVSPIIEEYTMLDGSVLTRTISI